MLLIIIIVKQHSMSLPVTTNDLKNFQKLYQDPANKSLFLADFDGEGEINERSWEQIKIEVTKDIKNLKSNTKKTGAGDYIEDELYLKILLDDSKKKIMLSRMMSQIQQMSQMMLNLRKSKKVMKKS
jgi:hypothetical protein